MIEAQHSPLRVEPLKPKHLRMLNSNEHSNIILLLQSVLLRSWLAIAEQRLTFLFQARQPYCNVALENENLIGFNILQPYNIRGTCWAISIPEILIKPKQISINTVKESLIKRAIEAKPSKARGWIIRCPTTEIDTIAIARENGFQPLKIIKCWAPPPQFHAGRRDWLCPMHA